MQRHMHFGWTRRVLLFSALIWIRYCGSIMAEGQKNSGVCRANCQVQSLENCSDKTSHSLVVSRPRPFKLSYSILMALPLSEVWWTGVSCRSRNVYAYRYTSPRHLDNGVWTEFVNLVIQGSDLKWANTVRALRHLWSIASWLLNHQKVRVAFILTSHCMPSYPSVLPLQMSAWFLHW